MTKCPVKTTDKKYRPAKVSYGTQLKRSSEPIHSNNSTFYEGVKVNIVLPFKGQLVGYCTNCTTNVKQIKKPIYFFMIDCQFFMESGNIK